MNENKPRRRAQAARAAQKATRKSGLSRFVLMVAMMALVAVVSIGGTMAWLQASTTEITNTFSTSNIEIDLDETTGTEYQIIPGSKITKDPLITASSNAPYYVFAKLTKSANWPEEMTYAITEGWTSLTAGDGETISNYNDSVDAIYYKAMDKGVALTKDNGGYILASNQILVDSTMLESDMPTEAPTLTVKAYAIQQANSSTTTFSPVAAWNTVSAAAPVTP